VENKADAIGMPSFFVVAKPDMAIVAFVFERGW